MRNTLQDRTDIQKIFKSHSLAHTQLLDNVFVVLFRTLNEVFFFLKGGKEKNKNLR